MASCISRIYDDYDTYVSFCKLIKETPIGVRDGFYDHEKELMEKHSYVTDGCWYKKVDTIKNLNKMTNERKIEILKEVLEKIDVFIARDIGTGICGALTHIHHMAHGVRYTATHPDWILIKDLDKLYRLIYKVKDTPSGYWWKSKPFTIECPNKWLLEWYKPRIEFVRICIEIYEQTTDGVDDETLAEICDKYYNKIIY